MPGDSNISPLILAELYDAADEAFLDRLANFRGNFKPLVGIIEKWKKDRSTWARRMKLRFAIDVDLFPEHRLIFKRLFKQAWHDNDHELMSAFLVRLDRTIRRKRSKHYRFLGRGNVEVTETLRARSYPRTSIFSGPTTHYLRRRAWRYFRRVGFKQPADYPAAVGRALVRYRDEDLRAGENLLDNWGLMHACFGKSPVIVFNKRHTNLRASQRLASLEAAPMFERLWANANSLPVLLSILLDAQCRAVRVWTIQLLKRHHLTALASIDATMLLRLLDHADEDVAVFAAELLNNAQMVASLPMTTWLKLLATRNPNVVAMIAEAFKRNVNPDRVTLPQAAEIAASIATPVARIGLQILEARTPKNDAEREAVASLASAKCAAVAGEIAAYALSHLNKPGAYVAGQVIAFFDSPLAKLRDGAFAALEPQSPAATDPGFWSALLESPYDDVRTNLVASLKRRESLPGVASDRLAMLWLTVLLNIHRGGRAKLSALVQISRQITLEPESATTLLPVVAVAIRSVRGPEARHGLAAVVSAVERVPSLEAAVRQYFPELQLDAAAVGR